jgi:hypothetical protein
MASTYSQYKIELVGTGEQAGTWGITTNNNFGSDTPGTYQGFEQAIGGRADITMSGTPITLSLTNSNAAQDARALYLNLTDSPGGPADLVVPALQKSYIVKNGSDQVVTVKVTGQTGVAVPVGKTMWLYNNGTDVTNAIDNLPSGATVGGVAISTASGTVTSVNDIRWSGYRLRNNHNRRNSSGCQRRYRHNVFWCRRSNIPWHTLFSQPCGGGNR